MKVEKTIDLGNRHKIEFGESTWDEDSLSVRNRYPTSTGGFSPRSSSEIPLNDVKLIVINSIEHGYLSKDDIFEIIESGLNELKKQSK